VLVLLGTASLKAQQVFSRFDFNTNQLKTATIGPAALYIDPDARQINGSLYMRTDCGSNKGFEMQIANEDFIFDVPSLGMTYRWEKHENFAQFFDRDGMSFYIQGGFLFIQYRTEDGITPTGTIDYGPIPTGYFAPADNQYHEYTFEYRSGQGVAEVFVDGNSVWSFDGPDGRDLVWDSSILPEVGIIMDGTCDQDGVLDWCEFYLPNESLPVDFLDISANWNGNATEIRWVTANEINNDHFEIQRSQDGNYFESIGEQDAAGAGIESINSYDILDDGIVQAGTYWYRIRQIDDNGSSSLSETVGVEVDASALSILKAFPNPSNGNFRLQFKTGASSLSVVGMDGRIAYTQEIPSSDKFPAIDVALPELAPGIYILLVQYSGRQESLKLMIR
jgi:hypothetical protein